MCGFCLSLKPGGCLIKTLCLTYANRNAFFMSMRWTVYPRIAASSANMIRTVVMMASIALFLESL